MLNGGPTAIPSTEQSWAVQHGSTSTPLWHDSPKSPRKTNKTLYAHTFIYLHDYIPGMIIDLLTLYSMWSGVKLSSILAPYNIEEGLIV